MQHRSTWRWACPPELPIKTIPEPPVGVLTFRLPLPNGWALILDDGALPEIAHGPQVCLDNKDQNLHREITPIAPTHVPSQATLPQHCLQGCVCVTYCFRLFISIRAAISSAPYQPTSSPLPYPFNSLAICRRLCHPSFISTSPRLSLLFPSSSIYLCTSCPSAAQNPSIRLPRLWRP